MSDVRLNDKKTASDAAYIYAEAADGQQVRISKADLASVVAELSNVNFGYNSLQELSKGVADSAVFHPLQNREDTDANLVTEYGFHCFAASPTINFPSDTNSQIRFMLVYGYESRLIQLLFTPSKGLIHTRQFMNTWSEWVQV